MRLIEFSQEEQMDELRKTQPEKYELLIALRSKMSAINSDLRTLNDQLESDLVHDSKLHQK